MVNLTRFNIFVLGPRVALALGILLFIAAVGKLRRELDAVMTANRWPVTFSVGLGIFNSVLASEDAMISFTDKLMYRVKSAGKNNVSIEVFVATS